MRKACTLHACRMHAASACACACGMCMWHVHVHVACACACACTCACTCVLLPHVCHPCACVPPSYLCAAALPWARTCLSIQHKEDAYPNARGRGETSDGADSDDLIDDHRSERAVRMATIARKREKACPLSILVESRRRLQGPLYA